MLDGNDIAGGCAAAWGCFILSAWITVFVLVVMALYKYITS